MKNNKSNNKSIVDIYSPTIYPVELHVIRNMSIDKIKSKYNIDYTIDEDHSWAYTISGIYLPDKPGKNISIVILTDGLLKCKDILQKVNTAAHEATHFVLDVAEFIGLEQSQKSQESYSYLLGWATECIFSTLYRK